MAPNVKTGKPIGDVAKTAQGRPAYGGATFRPSKVRTRGDAAAAAAADKHDKGLAKVEQLYQRGMPK